MNLINKFKILLMIGVLSFGIAGCSETSEKVHEEGQNIGDLFDGSRETSFGSYSFGLTKDVGFDELVRFEYSGEEIRVPYHVEGMDEAVISEMGLFFFVDGVPQSTRLETAEGEIISDTGYMHNFNLKFQERIEFDVVFTPISGEIGDRVGLIAGALLRPEFLPESIENPGFGVFHALSATIPMEIQMNTEISNQRSAYSNVSVEVMPQDMLDEIGMFLGESDVFEHLDRMGNVELLPNGDEEGVIYVEDGKAKITLRTYGGAEILNRITIFVNNQPVQVNGADFVEVQMERGKLVTVELELELEDLEELNSIYGIAMTAGDDYLIQDIFKSQSMLLVNK